MAETPAPVGCYGWNRQRPDWRDKVFSIGPGVVLPSHVNLTNLCPPIWNQGRLGSCTAHGTLRAYYAARKKQGQNVFMPSRLLQYYDARSLEHTTLIDIGATCRDSIKAIAYWGSCDEALWPYDISKFNHKPPAEAYAQATLHQAIKYHSVEQSVYAIKAILAQGLCIAFGFTVYQNFEHTGGVARTGLMEMPVGGSVGGHCVTAVGYNSHSQLMCANSWGTQWGDPDFPGHFWCPPEYYTNPRLASDFWVIESTEP